MAFYEPPLEKRPKRYSDGLMRSYGAKGKVCQLATYRSKPGNAEGGSALEGKTNGHDWRFRVLCNLRVQVGLALRGKMPGSVDLYGRGWPIPVKGNSRNRQDFLELRHEIVKDYAFDLNWENMEIPHYVSEKFWSPRAHGHAAGLLGSARLPRHASDGHHHRCAEVLARPGLLRCRTWPATSPT